jgi:hypothetical protein
MSIRTRILLDLQPNCWKSTSYCNFAEHKGRRIDVCYDCNNGNGPWRESSTQLFWKDLIEAINRNNAAGLIDLSSYLQTQPIHFLNYTMEEYSRIAEGESRLHVIFVFL